MPKYLFLSGGVCSSLGKGIAISSIANLLERREFKISMLKIDPYMNVDAGTISPYQHGEVYVTTDGAETDLDLGHYYRFTKQNIKKENSLTAGQIYQELIMKERRGDFLGKTVQMIPHITDSIKNRIKKLSHGIDIVMVEIGGTVGDYESIPFLEACRQMILEEKKEDVISLHMTLIPQVVSEGIKTKPTQHSVKELRSLGIQPNIIVTRLNGKLEEEDIKKISLFTNVKEEEVFYIPNVENLYEVPLVIREQKLEEKILSLFNLPANELKIKDWQLMVDKLKRKGKHEVKITLVGKYIESQDSYKSVDEALFHAGIELDLDVKIERMDAENLNFEKLAKTDGIIIPGGFGERGSEGIIEAIKFARENKKILFAICLGMQLFVIEFFKNVLGYEGANSTEFEENCKHPVVSLLKEQKRKICLGGTMRLGNSKIKLENNSKIKNIYGKNEIEEIHRHRYEVDPKYEKLLENTELLVSGFAEIDGEKLVESVEYKNHPWAIAVQYHPEFTSRPLAPVPLFREFVNESFKNQKQ